MSLMSLAAARALLGWSTERLGKEARVPPTNVRDIEAGRNRNPSHALVTKLVRALQRGGLQGVSTYDLFPVDDIASSHPPVNTDAIASEVPRS